MKTNIIYENDNFISFKDTSPKSKGHSLVIPKKHYSTILDCPAIFGSDLIDCIKSTTIKLMKESGFSGFNIIQNNFKIAGQIVNHLHFHIIPRYKNDGIQVLE